MRRKQSRGRHLTQKGAFALADFFPPTADMTHTHCVLKAGGPEAKALREPDPHARTRPGAVQKIRQCKLCLRRQHFKRTNCTVVGKP